MNACTKYFNNNSKYINHLVKDEKILKQYLIKKNNLIKEELNSELVYNDKDIKTTIKIYNDKVYTNFQNNKITVHKCSLKCIF